MYKTFLSHYFWKVAHGTRHTKYSKILFDYKLLRTGKRSTRVQKQTFRHVFFLSVPFFDKIASKETSIPHFSVNMLFRDKHRYRKF